MFNKVKTAKEPFLFFKMFPIGSNGLCKGVVIKNLNFYLM